MPAHWLPDPLDDPDTYDMRSLRLEGLSLALVRGSLSPRCALAPATEATLRAIAADHHLPAGSLDTLAERGLDPIYDPEYQYHTDTAETILCCLYRPVGHRPRRRRTDAQGGNVALWTALLLSVILPLVMAAHGMAALSTALRSL